MALGDRISVNKYIRNSETITGRLQDEIVMMDINQGKYFSLNPVATQIWEFLEDSISLEDLGEKLVEEYDVDPEQCIAEVGEHLREMMKLGLVKEI